MSWFNGLATGFVQGLLEGILECSANDGRDAPDHHYDFRRLIHGLAAATGVRLGNVSADRASFTLVFRGETCFGSVGLAGETVFLTVYSKIQFPRHGVPHRVVQEVKGLNASLPRCDFELLDLDDCSVWCVQGAANVRELSAAVFGSALAELSLCICRLDVWLSENGFAS